MDRRTAIGTVGLTALGAATAGSAIAADDTKHAAHRSIFMDCAKACSACARECQSCFDHCADLVSGGNKQHAETMRSCIDCAVLCAAADALCARSSSMAFLACTACEKACEQCAEACEKFPNDQHMAACTKECRKCADKCREMLKHSEHVNQ